MTAAALPAPRRILVVTDLGAAGSEAVRAGARRAAATGAALAVVHVMPSVGPTALAAHEAAVTTQVRAALTRQVTQFARHARAAEFVRTGGVAEQALALAQGWEADLVVTGAPEDGAVDTLRIVRHAAAPVLIARATDGAGPVIACTDFSDPALPAVQTAADEARRAGARLHVLHAFEPIPAAIVGIEGRGIVPTAEWTRARRADAEARLARALADTGVDGDYAALEGAVATTLLATARTRGAQLLVLGTVGCTGVTRFLLGSVAETLVRDATCPTLIVRLALRDGGT
ncbi:MAG: universal stress protein [Myxococcales bacterium]|nr:universal stress protein [Myxococcales bacterium]